MATPSNAGLKRQPQTRQKMWLIIIVAVLAIAAAAYAIGFTDTHPRTNDAFAQADAIGVASQVGGRIIELKVKDNAAVKKGDVLFTIDPRPYRYEAERLQAQLVTLERQIGLTQRQVDAQKFAALASEATVTRAEQSAAQRESTLARMEPLLKGEFVTKEQVDQARTARDTAQSELKAALLEHKRAQSAVSGVDALVAQKKELDAAIANAEYQLEQTVVRAPFDGRVVDLNIAEGEYASVGRPLFTLIDTRTWYVVANFRETELPSIRPGTHVSVYLMIDPSRKFKGVVDSIGWGVLPDEGGSAQGLPQVPKSINWVHVAQRFPVRIRVTDPAPDLFRIGASAVAVVTPSARDER
jgi:membrane fusion protein, multidrug efflux system